MTIEMEELQENIGVKNRILFKILLAEMIERKIVKYVDRIELGKKRRYFWTE